MNRPSGSLICAFAFSFSVPGCGNLPEGSSVPRPRLEQAQAAQPAPKPLPELLWWPDGSRVVVDGQWVLDVNRGVAKVLGCDAQDQNRCRERRISVAPDGLHFLVTEGERLAVGTLHGPMDPWQAIPRWVHADEVANAVFWLSPNTLFVQQFPLNDQAKPTCRWRQWPAGNWRRPPGGCLEPEFRYLSRVDAGPNALLALHSSAEGLFALSIVRYGLTTGQDDTPLPALVLEGSSAVRVSFAADGSRIDLVSPCVLDGNPPPPCENPEGQAFWRLYSRTTNGGPLRLRATDLPPGATADPKQARFAWPKDGEVCLGNPRESPAKCASAPASP